MTSFSPTALASLLDGIVPNPVAGDLLIPNFRSFRVEAEFPFSLIPLTPDNAPLLRECGRSLVQDGPPSRVSLSDSGRCLEFRFPWKNWNTFEVTTGWTGLSQTVGVRRDDRIRTKSYFFGWTEESGSLEGFKAFLGLPRRASLAQVALEATNWIYASGQFAPEEWGGAPILRRIGVSRPHWENRSLRGDGGRWDFPGRDSVRGKFSISIRSRKPLFNADADKTGLGIRLSCPGNRDLTPLNPALMSLWQLVRADFLS